MERFDFMSLNTPLFTCQNVTVGTEDKRIVNGVDLSVYPGEIHALMGPNGSGKSTFAAGLMGSPNLKLAGKVIVDGVVIDNIPPHERAKAGLFLGFQYPVAIPGVTVSAFLKAALGEIRGGPLSVMKFKKELHAVFDTLGVPWSFAERYLNDGFSGGEKKRLEIVQMLLLKPKFVVLDEIDSGLDVDALKTVAMGVNRAASQGTGILLVTHYQRLLDLVVPHKVHYFMDGKIVYHGGPETVHHLEAHGYDWIKQNVDHPSLESEGA